MQIKLRGNRVAIEKVKKAAKKGGTEDFLVIPESEEYAGIVRYVGPDASSDIKVGQKVYFATSFQEVRMGGVTLCVLEDKMVYATIED
jgi:co-chaperonin GroES (HSP10)